MNSPSPDAVPEGVRAPRVWVRYITILTWCAILVGCALRFSQLSTRVLFVDEAITQIRVAGHTYAEMNAALFDGRQRPVDVVRSYAQVDAGSTAGKVVVSLVKEDAQHPPLFYLAELAIVRAFGNALAVWRLFSAICGVLSVIAAYALARELFGDSRAPIMAAALMAVSPIERIYSQQAREYSLFALLVLVSTIAVVRAVRTKAAPWWAVYAVLAAAGLYASPFMAYIMAAHAVFAIGMSRRAGRIIGIGFALSAAAAFAAYAPWLYELALHRGSIVVENSWSATRWSAGQLAAKWIFNSGSTFFDLEYMNLRWGLVLGLVGLVVIVAMWRGFRDSEPIARWCLGAALTIPSVLLIAPDLLLGEHRSAIARYGLPVFTLLLIVVARGLCNRPLSATIVLAAGLAACTIGAMHPSWWDNDASADDAHIASAIERRSGAQVITRIAPPDFLTVARLLGDDARVSFSPNLATAEFTLNAPLFVLDASAQDLEALRTRTGLTFVDIPYAHTLTAHEIGAQLTNPGSTVQGASPPLFEGEPGAALAHGRL
jgi:uncharacterized membrane protein